MDWWRQIKMQISKLRQGRGSKGPVMRRASYESPVGTFVQYSTVFNCCNRHVSPMQQTFVVNQDGAKQSNYLLWLN